MIRHMRHGSSLRLLALQSILSPNRRESLPAPSAGVRMRNAGYYYSRALRVVLLVVAEVRCHVEQEQSRALGSRAGGGCWADCPAVWARGAASTRPDLSSGPACSLGAEERLAPRRGSRR